MLAIERRNAILSKISVEGKVLVSNLSQEFGVTEETIRRDLEKLDTDGLVKKTYGGAVKNENYNIDMPFHVRQQENIELKQHIASIVASMIHDGDYIMIDSSTTALYVIRNILHLNKITLITNSIEILLELFNKTDWTIISTGGVLKEGGLSLLGYQAEKMISGFHADIAICSCKGVNFDLGITDSNERDSEIKKAFFRSVKKKVLVADSTKFNKTAFTKICDLGELDAVVTDSDPGIQWQQYCKDNSVELKY